MTYLELAEACSVYNCCGSVDLSRRRVNHSQLAAFAILLNRFRANYREELSDEIWNPFMRFMKRQSYRMQAIPLPFSEIRGFDTVGLKKAAAFVEKIKYIYPDVDDDARALFESYDRVSALDDNPIGDLILHEFSSGSTSDGHSAILLKDSKWIASTENLFCASKKFRKLHVISPEDLKAGDCYGRIFCVGPARWFPDYVFSSARAMDISVFCYRWISDRKPIQTSFPVGSTHVVTSKLKPANRMDRLVFVDSNDFRDEFVDAEELVPTVNIAGIQERIRQETSGNDYVHEVSAHLFVLEGDCLVMLETERDSKTLVIDPLSWHNDNEGAEATVNRIHTSEIEPGMFAVIRSGGAGDYIEPMADEILGSRAAGLRSYQNKWKKLLRAAVREAGTEQAIKSLKAFGSDKANYINLMNWMSTRKIKTRDFADFQAIMRLIGLEDEADELWQAAEEIHAAHRSAGFSIRRVLIDRISQTSIRDLQRTGKTTFKIGETEEGSMLVLRVKKILPETFTVPESSVGKLLEGSDDLWQ
ncbi:MAG: hypothetical protein ACLPVO_07565 [Desulfomonilaceae bacterium]